MSKKTTVDPQGPTFKTEAEALAACGPSAFVCHHPALGCWEARPRTGNTVRLGDLKVEPKRSIRFTKLLIGSNRRTV